MRRVDIDVNIAPGEDVDATRKALEAAIAAIPGADAKSAPQVFLKGFGGGMVMWQVRVWCSPDVYWDVWQATVRAVAYELGRAKIALAYAEQALTTDALSEPAMTLAVRARIRARHG